MCKFPSPIWPYPVTIVEKGAIFYLIILVSSFIREISSEISYLNWYCAVSFIDGPTNSLRLQIS